MGIAPRPEQKERGTGQSDGCRLKVQSPVEKESQNDAAHDDQRLLQRRLIHDQYICVQGLDVR